MSIPFHNLAISLCLSPSFTFYLFFFFHHLLFFLVFSSLLLLPFFMYFSNSSPFFFLYYDFLFFFSKNNNINKCCNITNMYGVMVSVYCTFAEIYKVEASRWKRKEGTCFQVLPGLGILNTVKTCKAKLSELGSPQQSSQTIVLRVPCARRGSGGGGGEHPGLS